MPSQKTGVIGKLDDNRSVCFPTSPPPIVSDASTLHSNLLIKCHNFNIPTDETAKDVNTNISNCQYVGSYNWVSDHSDVSIIVPGSPRHWQEQPLPYTVPPDIQGHYRDQYDSRMRSAPLLPLLLAVNNWHERTHPHPSKFPWHDVDFVTNRNSLRHLLRILRTDAAGSPGSPGTGARRGKNRRHGSFSSPYSKPFRIDIELAGKKTILLNRWEPTNSEPLDFNSYGFNFENAFTREAEAVSSLDEAGETARHHRINSYDFGGLYMVVRSEIDACIDSCQTYPHVNVDEVDGHEVLPQALTSQSSPIVTPFGLRIIPSQNQPTRQSHLLELSTTKSTPFPTWNAKERYPQLHFSQVPNLYLARHVHGTIVEINKRHLHKSPEMIFYAPIIEPNFRKLRKLLGLIQSVVVAQASRSPGARGSFSLVYLHGRLSLFERVGKRCLPDEVFAMFDV